MVVNKTIPSSRNNLWLLPSGVVSCSTSDVIIALFAEVWLVFMYNFMHMVCDA